MNGKKKEICILQVIFGRLPAASAIREASEKFKKIEKINYDIYDFTWYNYIIKDILKNGPEIFYFNYLVVLEIFYQVLYRLDKLEIF